MPIKSKSIDCEFYKVHKFYAEKSVENIGGTCAILNKTSKTVVDNKVVTFDLEQNCPFKKLENYEKLKESWETLRKYVDKLEFESGKVGNPNQKLMLDIS